MTYRSPRRTTLLIVGGVLLMTFAMFPYLIAFLGSWLPDSAIVRGAFFEVPKYSLANYVGLFQLTNFGRAILNSFINATLSALLAVVISAPGAFAFSRIKFRLKRLVLVLILVTQMFPGALLVLSLVRIIQGLGLLNTYGGLALAYLTQTIPVSLWLLIVFFQNVPMELDEAARVDGCSYWQIFYRVIIPLSLAGISAILFFAFIAAWNDLLYILVLAQGQSMATTQVFLYSMVGQFTTSWGLLLTASVMSTIPAVVLYFIVQKSLIGGILAGSVKG